MATNETRRGFAGLEDLVSDVTDDIARVQRLTSEKQQRGQRDAERSGLTHPASSASSVSSSSATSPQDGAEQEPFTYKASAPRRNGRTGLKWVAGLIIAFVVLAWLISSKEGGTPSRNSVTEAPQIVPQPSIEDRPPAGANNLLDSNQVRYCLSEDVRLKAMRQGIDRYSGDQVHGFNMRVADYNSRCSQFRYHRGVLEEVRQEVEANRLALEREGLERLRAANK